MKRLSAEKSGVLVTGGAGFIGSHVVDRLIAAGHVPVIFDVRRSRYHDDVETVLGDVRDRDAVLRAVRGCDFVIHLAAAADVGEVAKDPVGAEQVNCRGTVNVLDAARAEGVERVVYASTIWVYSEVEEEEVDEDTLLPAPAHLYTATKLAGELYCRSYAQLFGLETTILRFGIPYGPRARAAAVVPTFADRALAGEPLAVAGGGTQARRFVYVEDLAEGVVRALAPAAGNRTFNLVSAQDVTIREVADTVRDVVGDVEILEVDGRAADFGGARVSGRRAAEVLHWHAQTPFAEGVRRYVAWRQEQLEAPDDATESQQPAARLAAVRGLVTSRAVMLLVVGAFAGALAAVFTRSGAFEDPSKFLSILLLCAIPAALVAGLTLNPKRGEAVLVVAALLCGSLITLQWDWSAPVVHFTSHHVALTVVLVLVAASALARVRRMQTAPP